MIPLSICILAIGFAAGWVARSFADLGWAAVERLIAKKVRP